MSEHMDETDIRGRPIRQTRGGTRLRIFDPAAISPPPLASEDHPFPAPLESPPPSEDRRAGLRAHMVQRLQQAAEAEEYEAAALLRDAIKRLDRGDRAEDAV